MENKNNDRNNEIAAHDQAMDESTPSPPIRRTTGPMRKSTKGGWTELEDQKLMSAVQTYDAKHWRAIANFVGNNRDHVQCLHRWQKVLNPAIVKGRWTEEEDDQIIKLVGEVGTGSWSKIAKSLKQRTGKQCRDRWSNHLKPGLKKTSWTGDEDRILVQAHQQYGNKWAEISKLLPGRPENAIKNRWNCSLKNKADYFHDLHSSQGSNSVLNPPSSPAHSDYEGATPPGSTCRLAASPSRPFQQTDDESEASDYQPPPGDNDIIPADTTTSPTSPRSHSSHHDKELTTSPKSFLRSAARSYENVPSIIRRRSLKNNASCSPGRKEGAATESKQVGDCGDYGCSTIADTKSGKLGSSVAVRSVGRCLCFDGKNNPILLN